MKPKKGRYCRVLVLSQMRWARVLADCDWPGLAIQRGARARDRGPGPISTEGPRSFTAVPNLDAARGGYCGNPVIRDSTGMCHSRRGTGQYAVITIRNTVPVDRFPDPAAQISARDLGGPTANQRRVRIYRTSALKTESRVYRVYRGECRQSTASSESNLM